MAKKKITSVDALNIFKDVMTRALLSEYQYTNRIMIARNTKKGNLVMICPEVDLWNMIIDDPDMKIHMSELLVNDPEQNRISQVTSYMDDLSSDQWIPLDTDLLYKGKVIHLSIEGFDYKIPVNRDLLPLKLRKKEYSGIHYRVFITPFHILAIKKKFESPLEEGKYGFELVRLLQIV